MKHSKKKNLKYKQKAEVVNIGIQVGVLNAN